MPGADNPYEIELSPAAERAVRKLSPENRRPVLAAIGALRANPRPPGIVALKGARGYLRLRTGDYRVIYAVDDEAQLVSILVVGHRRDVYALMRRAGERPMRLQREIEQAAERHSQLDRSLREVQQHHQQVQQQLQRVQQQLQHLQQQSPPPDG